VAAVPEVPPHKLKKKWIQIPLHIHAVKVIKEERYEGELDVDLVQSNRKLVNSC
jgi:hypothetical protein